MIIYLALLGLLCLWGIKFSGFRENYISKEQTGSFKGIFAMLIFFSHIAPHTSVISSDALIDKLYWGLFQLMGQMVVVIFLFYSGYGIMESIKNKPGYMKGFFKKRIVKIFIEYNIATLVYAVVRACMGQVFPWKHYLLSLIGLQTVANIHANGNWFIFGILTLYLATMLLSHLLTYVFWLKEKKYQVTLTVYVVAMNILMIYLLMRSSRSDHWFNTLFAYSFGMIYSLCRESFEKAMRKTQWYLLTLIAVCGCMGVIVLFDLNNIVFYSAMGCLFSLLLVLISMHIRIQNSVLIWLGKLSFSNYIIHRGVMLAFQSIFFGGEKVPRQYQIPYVALCLTVTLVLSQLHYWVSEKATGVLLKQQKAI